MRVVARRPASHAPGPLIAPAVLTSYFVNGYDLTRYVLAYDAASGTLWLGIRVRGQIGDTALVGISPDPPNRQAKFDQKYGLGFPLLADEDHAVAEAYGTWGEKKLYGRSYMGIIRSAFLVDPKGRIEQAWYKVSPKDTAANLLKALS